MFNLTFIHFFEVKGAVFGTALGVGSAVMLNLWKVKHSIDFSYRKIAKRVMLISIFTAIMTISVWLTDRKSTRLNSSHVAISYAVFCLKKKNIIHMTQYPHLTYALLSSY